MRIGEFLERWGGLVPWDGAAGWDRVGLQLGDRQTALKKLAICHEVTEEVVESCVQERPDLLLTYHPLLFRPTTNLLAGKTPQGRAWRLAKAGVSLAVIHTAFDVVSGGMADALAERLGLTDIRGFGILDGAEQIKIVVYVPPEASDRVASAMTDAGAGSIGLYGGCSFRTAGTGYFLPTLNADPTIGTPGQPERAPETKIEMVAPSSRREQIVAALVSAHPYQQPAFQVSPVTAQPRFVGRVGNLNPPLLLSAFSGRVREHILSDGMRVAGEQTKLIQRVAVLPGSGSSYLSEAIGSGADLFVTGEVSHHRMLAAVDAGMAVVDAGHTPTERPGVERMPEWCDRIFSGEILDLTGLDPTPWT